MKIRILWIVFIGIFLSISCKPPTTPATSTKPSIDEKDDNQIELSELKSIQDSLEFVLTLPSQKVNAIGLTVVDNASLIMERDSGIPEIKKVDFGIPHLILEKRPFRTKKGMYYWYKVISMDKKYQGWIIWDEFKEAPIELVNLETNDLSGLYYDVAKKYTWGSIKHEIPLRIFNIILKKYAQQNISIHEEDYGDLVKRNGKILALNGIAKIFKHKKEYQKAADKYQEIIKDALAKNYDILKAKYELLEIYRKHLKKNDKIIEICHDIIKNHPNEEIVSFESNFWVDIWATKIIYDLLSQSEKFDRLKKECNKILKTSKNPPVEIIATSGLIAKDIYDKNDKAAINKIIKILKKYPNEIRTYFKSDYNYSYFPISSALNTKNKYVDDNQNTILFVETLKNNIQYNTLIEYINFNIAQLKDNGNGHRDEVISAYKNLNFSPNYYYDPIENRLSPSQITTQRFKKIKSFEPEKAIVNNTTTIKESLHSKTNGNSVIEKGTSIIVQYKDTELKQLNGKSGYWTKVVLPNKKIGWVFDQFITSFNTTELTESLQYKNQSWSMEAANVFHSNYIDAPLIKRPEIVDVIHNVRSKEVIIDDLNDDNVLDILTHNKEELILINGKDQTNIWSFKGKYLSTPLVTDDAIVLIANNNNETLLYQLNKYSGKILWEVVIGHIRNSSYPVSPIQVNSKIIIGTNEEVMAVDYDSGEIKRRKPNYYLVFNTITTDLDNVFFCSKETISGDDILYSVNSEDGKLNWKYSFNVKSKRGYIAGSAYQNGLLYISGPNDCLYAIDAKKGKLKWKTQVRKNGTTTGFRPSVKGGKVFYTSSINKKVCAFNSKNGLLDWQYNYDYGFSGSPTIVNGAVYVPSFDGYIHALSFDDGQLIWKIKTGNSAYGGRIAISVVNGLLFICSTDNNLYIIGEEPN